jgi:hypothetical protein
MKKLLIYLILIGCFESFISATPCLSYSQDKRCHFNGINTSSQEEALQEDDINAEIHPLNIFSFRLN